MKSEDEYMYIFKCLLILKYDLNYGQMSLNMFNSRKNITKKKRIKI